MNVRKIKKNLFFCTLLLNENSTFCESICGVLSGNEKLAKTDNESDIFIKSLCNSEKCKVKGSEEEGIKKEGDNIVFGENISTIVKEDKTLNKPNYFLTQIKIDNKYYIFLSEKELTHEDFSEVTQGDFKNRYEYLRKNSLWISIQVKIINGKLIY